MVRIHWGAQSFLLTERRSDALKSNLDIAEDERGIEPYDAIAGALKRRITARISAPARYVIPAIDLDHEALRRSQ